MQRSLKGVKAVKGMPAEAGQGYNSSLKQLTCSITET